MAKQPERNPRRAPRPEKWHPPRYVEGDGGLPGTYSKEDMRAIQALAQGKAGEHDQIRAINWIINIAAATYDEPFSEGKPDVVNYMLGRRSVGLAIIKLIKLQVGKIDKETD